MAAGLLSPMLAPLPDLLVSNDARLIALRSEGSYWVQSRPANALGGRQKRLEPRELSIRQVSQVGSPQGQTPAILPGKPAYVPVFRQFLVSRPRSS